MKSIMNAKRIVLVVSCIAAMAFVSNAAFARIVPSGFGYPPEGYGTYSGSRTTTASEASSEATPAVPYSWGLYKGSQGYSTTVGGVCSWSYSLYAEGRVELWLDTIPGNNYAGAGGKATTSSSAYATRTHEARAEYADTEYLYYLRIDEPASIILSGWGNYGAGEGVQSQHQSWATTTLTPPYQGHTKAQGNATATCGLWEF